MESILFDILFERRIILARIKIRGFKKIYTDAYGEPVPMQPMICSNCGYDSAADIIESHRYCPNCGEKIEGFDGKILNINN
jgi:predicted Zn-ribbon and HTH transcriptional regulator